MRKRAGEKRDQAEVMEELGDRLRQARKCRGWPMRVLADKAGVSVSLISQVERAEVAPSLPTFLRLCEVLMVSSFEMLENL